MNFIFIFISSSDTNLLRKKICKTKNKNNGLSFIFVFSQYTKVNKSACDSEFLSRLHGESTEMQLIQDYIWTSWEDSVDVNTVKLLNP